jgi:hypothetical protein
MFKTIVKWKVLMIEFKSKFKGQVWHKYKV